MSWFDPKGRGASIAKDAQAAAEAGQTVFAVMMSFQPANPARNFTTGTVGDWAEIIQAVEAVGWRLDQWAVTSQDNGTSRAYPVFRRTP